MLVYCKKKNTLNNAITVNVTKKSSRFELVTKIGTHYTENYEQKFLVFS